MDEDAPATDPTIQDDHSVRRRLVRRSSGRVIAGVATGLADHTGVDPAIFRIGFIALTVVGGLGILLYLLAWLMVPEDHDSDRFVERAVRRLRGSRAVPLVLIGVAVVVLLERFSGLGSPMIWAVALIAMGVVLLRDETQYAPRGRTDDADAGPATAAEVAAERPPRVRRPRSPLTLYTLGACFLIVALAAALAGAGVVEMDLARYLGLALAAVGGGIVASAWWGRSLVLKLVGLALVPPLLFASIIDVPLTGPIGGRYVIGGEHALQRSYETLAGHVTLDLARYEFGDRPVVVDVGFVVGTMSAYVPPGVKVTVDSAMDAGRVSLFGTSRSGADLHVSGTFREPGSSIGEVILKVRGGVGGIDMSWAEWVEEEIRYEREQREQRELEERQERRERRAERQRRARAERRERAARSDG